MGSCTDLATKPEVAALRAEIAALKAGMDGKYIPQTEKAGIISSAVSISEAAIQGVATVLGAKIITASSLATEAKTVATVANTGVTALGSKVSYVSNAVKQADLKAVKAGFDATLAGRQASKAIGVANSFGSVAMKAFNLVTGVISIISTLATAVALAILTQQVVNLTRRVKANEQITRENEIRIADNEKITNFNTARIKEQQFQLDVQQELIDDIYRLIAEQNKLFAAQDIQIAAIRSESATTKIRLQEELEKRNVDRQTANEAKAIAELALQQALLALNKIPVPPPPTDLSGVYAQTDALEREIEILRSDNNGLRVALNTALAKIEEKEDKFIVRRVEKQTITNADGIRDLNGQIVGLPSKFGQQLDGATKTIKQDYEKADKDIRENVIKDVKGLNKPQIEEIVDTKLKGVTKMNEQQSVQINGKLDNIASKLPDVLALAAIATVVINKPDFQKVVSNSGKLSPCQAPALVPPVGAQTRANFAAIGTLQGVTVAQGGFIQKSVNAVAATTKTTLDVVKHGTYGLEAMQRFADTAWKATHADKVLSLANTALNIHNGIMLSKHLGQSMAFIADNVLATFGITDSTTGDAINVESFVRNKLNSIINQVLGVTQADALRRKLATYNRIYQTGANVLYSVRSIMDSTYDMAETTGENVSLIGNALRKAGTVRENAYKLMPTDFRSTSRVQRRLEKLGNAAETIEQVSSDALDITTEVKEMKANQKEFQDELEKATKVQSKESDGKKVEATSNPEHSEEDEIRAIPKEKGE